MAMVGVNLIRNQSAPNGLPGAGWKIAAAWRRPVNKPGVERSGTSGHAPPPRAAGERRHRVPPEMHSSNAIPFSVCVKLFGIVNAGL
jgi:hypothetical protein